MACTSSWVRSPSTPPIPASQLAQEDRADQDTDLRQWERLAVLRADGVKEGNGQARRRYGSMVAARVTPTGHEIVIRLERDPAVPLFLPRQQSALPSSGPS